MRLHSLYIKETKEKGKGVYTCAYIEKGTVIEVAPVIVMSAGERQLLDQTLLHDYIFEWGEDRSECAMALGWIPVYNHAAPSNCEYFMDFEDKTMFLKTVVAIPAGGELTINYNGDFDNNRSVWFDVKK